MKATLEEVSCRVKGCDHAPFSGRYAKNAESMHYHRVHAKSIQAPWEGGKKPKSKKKRRVTARFSLRNGKARFKGLEVSEIPLLKNGQPDRRSKEWRAANPKLAKPTGFMPGAAKHKKHGRKGRVEVRQVAVHFCPNCLTDLTKVAMGLVKCNQPNLHVNGCPSCGCNIKLVAEEMGRP